MAERERVNERCRVVHGLVAALQIRENPLQLRHRLLARAVVVRRYPWVPPEDLASEVRVVMPCLQQAIYVASGAEIAQSNLLPGLQEIEIPSVPGRRKNNRAQHPSNHRWCKRGSTGGKGH